MHRLIGLILVLLLAGCAQLGSLSTYNVSEADLEQMLTSLSTKLGSDIV